MAVSLAISSAAPVLPVPLDNEMLHGLKRYSDRFGGKPMTQQGLKALQSVPIVWAGLATREAETMAAAVRNMVASKSLQEIAIPGWIMLIEQAITETDGALRMPNGWKESLYYTTLATGKTKRETFMQKPTACLIKFKAIKTDYTKGAALWFSNHEDIAANLPSGTTPEDALDGLENDMWKQSVKEKAAEDLANFPPPPPREGQDSGGASSSVLPASAVSPSLATWMSEAGSGAAPKDNTPFDEEANDPPAVDHHSHDDNSTVISKTADQEDQHDRAATSQSSMMSPSSSSEEAIRLVEYEDERQLSDIMSLVDRDLSEPYSIFTYRYFLHNWPGLCFMAKARERTVGSIVCKAERELEDEPLTGYIAMLAVDTSFRKHGIGTALASRAIEAMRDLGCEEVVLETEVTNSGALNLYTKLGFSKNERLIKYYLNGVDAYRLKLWFR